MRRVNPNERTDIHMQTDNPGALGFQFTMFRPAGELKNEAVFHPGDLISDDSPEYLTHDTATWSPKNSAGWPRTTMGSSDTRVRGRDDTDSKSYWRRGEGPAYTESEDEGWNRKLQESHERVAEGRDGKPRTLYDDIAQHGVSKPVLLHEGDIMTETNTLMNGHHRVAAAADIDPGMEVPVIHGRFLPGSEYDHSKSSSRNQF